MDNRRKAHRALENAGAKITTVNTNARPIVPLYEGRSHIKIYAINDVAYIGGQNLIDTWRLDTAVRLRQPTAVEMLHKTVADLVKIGSTKKVFQDEDQRLMLPDGSELLRDAGKPGQSLIMDEALALIDDAEESITMTTQLFPRGVVARRLQAAARRGVAINVACDHNHTAPTVVRLLADGMHTTLRLIYGNDAAGHFTPKGLQALHSKILVSEKAAIVGSHNFDPTGVRLGNAEVSYLSRDPVFIAKVGEIALAQTTIASGA
jgi:phosphatidylserine/phosphatidylglycerophosphate/cardiolipin synthase-like enzyme